MPTARRTHPGTGTTRCGPGGTSRPPSSPRHQRHQFFAAALRQPARRSHTCHQAAHRQKTRRPTRTSALVATTAAPAAGERAVVLAPTHCGRCHESLPALAGPDDPEPTWHQVAELPTLVAEVVEYQGHYRTCPCCGKLNHAPIPQDSKRTASARAWPPPWCTWRAVITSVAAAWKRSPRTSSRCRCRWGRWSLAAADDGGLAPAHAEALTAVRKRRSRTSMKPVGSWPANCAGCGWRPPARWRLS